MNIDCITGYDDSNMDYIDYGKFKENENIKPNYLPSFLFLNDHKGKYFEKMAKKFENNNFEIVKQKFFSLENLNEINTKICKNVYKTTNIRIPLQNQEKIESAMHHYFDLYYNYQDLNIENQIKNINNQIIEYYVSKISSNLEFRKKYLYEINNPGHQYNNFQYPISTNIKGTKYTNESKRITNLFD